MDGRARASPTTYVWSRLAVVETKLKLLSAKANGEPVQLWTRFDDEDDEASYYNLGTRKTTTKPPVFKRGGILADDMVRRAVSYTMIS
jgi:hypothetical protein